MSVRAAGLQRMWGSSTSPAIPAAIGDKTRDIKAVHQSSRRIPGTAVSRTLLDWLAYPPQGQAQIYTSGRYCSHEGQAKNRGPGLLLDKTRSFQTPCYCNLGLHDPITMDQTAMNTSAGAPLGRACTLPRRVRLGIHLGGSQAK